MAPKGTEAVVAGHICLDVIPSIQTGKSLQQLLLPGRLIEVGGARLSTGGAVANTGLALHRLGISTCLMGKVGDDEFGQVILSTLRKESPALAEEMIVAPGEQSSYTIVLNIPGTDRIFLHCPGTNDTYQETDIRFERMGQSRLFHFGYPPLMKQMYTGGGEGLMNVMRRVKSLGMITSMDMAMPDGDSESGRVDWKSLLGRTLPYVDIFMPSLEETLYMLGCRGQEKMIASEALIDEIALQLLDMGCAIVALKLGESGLYLRTGTKARLNRMRAGNEIDEELWPNRQLWAPCYKTTVRGTTGAGDCTIAGFLAGVLKGLAPEWTMNGAVAVGAFCVEEADATSGIGHWETVEKRVLAKGERLLTTQRSADWRWKQDLGIWAGPQDRFY